jgi:hypothetical protein
MWRILKGQTFTDDPDINRWDGNENRERMRDFVFAHASQLFSPEDAAEMMALGRENCRSQPAWWIAAARLQPEKGAAILHEGLEFQREKNADEFLAAPLVACLWELEGQKEARFVADWYYARNSSGQATREKFWERLIPDDRDPAARKLLKLLLEDERAESLGNETLARMASQVNDWARQDVLTREEIRTLYGGGGKGGPFVESRAVPGALDRLRKSVPMWEH